MATMALHLKLVSIYKMLMFMAFIQHMHLQKYQLIPIDGNADSKNESTDATNGKEGSKENELKDNVE